jgi:hypothetical protein
MSVSGHPFIGQAAHYTIYRFTDASVAELKEERSLVSEFIS